MFLYTFHFSVTKHMKMISLSRRIHAKLAGTIYAKAGERKWGSNMKQSQMKEIVVPLLNWYDKNKRCLPWRADREPYHIWVSEIMLQQTRVEAVIPYYERFMKRLPSILSLADCEDEELFKLWEGLGYYSRARNLKKAAQEICIKHQGIFPSKFEEILTLPGIGAYTAGAISSIAFGEPRAAVDGNVLRVITRLTQDDREITDAKFRAEITQALERIYPQTGRGDFTQSLMELGAVVCVPNGKPKCTECPLAFLCGAAQNHTQSQYPVKKKKAERKIERKTVLLIKYQDKIAIGKRESKGVLSGMWELPNLDGELTKPQVLQWLSEQKFTVKEIQKMADTGKALKHIFTHIEWHMTCWKIKCESVANENGFTWVTAMQLENEIALPTAFKKVYQKMQKEAQLGGMSTR